MLWAGGWSGRDAEGHRQNFVHICRYADGMTDLVGFKPAKKPLRPIARRKNVVNFVRPKPWQLKKWRKRLPRLLFVPIALGIIAVAGTVGETDGPTGTIAPHAFPRSLNGGNAWNRTGGGFAGSASQTLIGTVTYIRDGDTFVVGTTPVRIANLDCAESGTRTGDMATRRASQLVNGQPVVCRLNTQTSYDRVIGKCSLADGRDFGRVMANELGCSLN